MPDFRITSDGNEQDIQEIYEMLKTLLHQRTESVRLC